MVNYETIQRRENTFYDYFFLSSSATVNKCVRSFTVWMGFQLQIRGLKLYIQRKVKIIVPFL